MDRPPQRLSRVVTLGQTWEPLPPPGSAGTASASQSHTTVVVVQPPPAYGLGAYRFGGGAYGAGYGSYGGYRSYGSYGSYGSGAYRAAPGLGPAPSSSVAPVGGDWPAAPSYGPRAMGRSSR